MKKRKVSSKAKPTVTMPQYLFEQLCMYLLSEYRSRIFLTKLDLFFFTVDTKIYLEDADIELHYRFARDFLKIAIDENIDDTSLICTALLESPKNKEDYDQLTDDLSELLENEPFDSNKAVFIENEIISRLNYVTAMPMVQEVKEAISAFENHEVDSFQEGVNLMSAACKRLNRTIISKSTTSLSIPDMSFSNDAFIHALDGVRRNMNDSKRYIKTGIKRLNKMLNGGFQPGRCYVFCGTSSGLTFSSL